MIASAWAPAGAWAGGLALLGAILGSFIATLAIRWPVGRSVVAGRSACDGCGRPLGAWELVPLLSFAVLRGRCATCRHPINRLHPAVEAVAAAIGLAAGLVAPGPEALAGAAFGWLLLALGTVDLLAFWLPDRLTAPLALGGLLAGSLGLEPPLADRAVGGAAGYLSLRLIAWTYRRLRGREGLGGGDAKLLGGIGLWLGWRPLPAVLFCACLVGLGAVLFRMLTGRAVRGGDMVPLGTLLALAAYPGWLLMVDRW